jgi:hypothetical protein
MQIGQSHHANTTEEAVNDSLSGTNINHTEDHNISVAGPANNNIKNEATTNKTRDNSNPAKDRATVNISGPKPNGQEAFNDTLFGPTTHKDHLGTTTPTDRVGSAHITHKHEVIPHTFWGRCSDGQGNMTFKIDCSHFTARPPAVFMRQLIDEAHAKNLNQYQIIRVFAGRLFGEAGLWWDALSMEEKYTRDKWAPVLKSFINKYFSGPGPHAPSHEDLNFPPPDNNISRHTTSGAWALRLAEEHQTYVDDTLYLKSLDDAIVFQ